MGIFILNLGLARFRRAGFQVYLGIFILKLRFSQVVLELDRAYLRNWSILCDPSKSKRGCLSISDASIDGLLEHLCEVMSHIMARLLTDF